MAKGKKTGGRDFIPGVVTNPNGRPKNPPELNALNKITKAQLTIMLNKLLQATPDQLKQWNGSVLELWLASGASKSIQKGDYSNLITLLDRLLGKVADKIEVTEVEQYSDEELIAKAEEALKVMKDKLQGR